MIVWFATPTFNPTRRLAGPFDTEDECRRACLQMTDRLTAINALVDGKEPCYYLPRPFESKRRTDDTSFIYTPVALTQALSQPPTPQTPPQRAKRGRRARLPLPMLVYRYQRAELVSLCSLLGLDPPPQGASRQAIREYITRQLGYD